MKIEKHIVNGQVFSNYTAVEKYCMDNGFRITSSDKYKGSHIYNVVSIIQTKNY